LVNDDLGLFIVADGMGGHSGGEVASRIAVKTVEDVVKENLTRLPSSRDLLTMAYEEASRRIFDKAATDSPELTGMGTTMVMIMARAESLFIANVGDSRAYLHRKPYLWQITEDHSLMYEQLRAGAINESQLKNFIGKNVITRSVGYEREVHVDIIERPLTKGDQFILCSDGLSGLVDDDKICKILNQFSGSQAVEKCVDEALANGGDDNVTVVLVEVS
jgi:protein phosphatase